MFDHVTRERPSVLITSRRGNYRAVLTFAFNAGGAKTGASVRVVSDAEGGAVGNTTAYTTTVREASANVSSGLWEVGYSCTPEGARLEPVTGEQWQAVCDAVRTTRLAQARAVAERDAARQVLQTAEQAVTAATSAVDAAQAAFNAAL